MRIGIAAVALVALAAGAGPARADAPWPEGYAFDTSVPGTVKVYVHNYQSRRCPDAGLLRRATASGQVVKITACDPGGSAEAPFTFVDECVPAGEYQYGLADPLQCTATAGTDRYATVTVTSGAAEGCTPTLAPAPEPVTSSSADEWPTRGPIVCGGSYGKLPTGCNTGGAVLGLDLAVLAAGLALWRRLPGRRGA